MKFQTKLVATTVGIALITLGVSLLGLWQTSRLGSALYEVGVVRLPSIQGLNLIRNAKTDLDASAPALSIPELRDSTIQEELDRQAHAWERAEEGWATYEPLPQTTEEAATWRTFVPAWKMWKASYEAAVSLAVKRPRNASVNLPTPGLEEAWASVRTQSSNVDVLLEKLLAINDHEATAAKQRSVASSRDLALVRNVMLLAAALSVFGAVGFGIALGRRVSRPLVEVADALSRIAQGDLSTPVVVRSRDEIGEIANVVNGLVQKQRATEAERAKADEALRKSEEKFSKVFMSAPVCIVVSNLATGYLEDVNSEFLRVLGYTRDEIVGHTSAEVGLWPVPQARTELVERLRAKGESYDHEQQLRAKDGSIRTVRAFAHVVELDDTAFLVSAFLDITEQKQAAEALRKSEEKFSKVFVSAPVGIAISGFSDARIVESNDEFLRLLGYQRDEVIGRSSLELGIWPDPIAREALVATLQLEGKSSSEQQLRSKSGEIRTVRAASHILELEGERFMLSAVVDVTDQRRAESERRHTEKLYRELVDGAQDVIVAITPDGLLASLNPAFERTLGWPRSQWIGQSFLGLVVSDDIPQASNQFQAALRDEPWPVTQLRTRTADGKIRIAEIYLTAQRENETVVGVLGIARDVTDRIQLEEEFHQAQKMEAVGRLAGGVAHDFNNILTAILGYCELLLLDLDPKDPQRADVAEIQKAGIRAAELTRQLLAFSRKQIIEPTRLNLNSVVSDIRPMLVRLIGEDVAVALKLQPELGPIKADHGQVEQVILNLAVNARDAMPNGGRLTIETSNVDLDDNYAATHVSVKPGPYVKLTVSDTGSGMTPEVQARLFEPFFTTKGVGKGTGLGLATVHGIVAHSGGSVGVYSEIGKGTSFKVYFPRADAAELIAAAPQSVAPGYAGDETVLLVEDADGLRELAMRLLQRQGYNVLVASNADEAARIFNDNLSIDVLLTDVVMPGASGPELSRQLIDQRPALKVIYMSGYTEDAIVDHGVLKPGIAFLNKPFTSGELARKLREVLDRNGST